MIGTQPTGALPGIVISAVAHEGLSVTIDGKPARLAIIDADGQVVAAGPQVAREAEAVAVNNYRSFLKGTGHLRVLSKPVDRVGGVGVGPFGPTPLTAKQMQASETGPCSVPVPAGLSVVHVPLSSVRGALR
jgi:hypothetical protein